MLFSKRDSTTHRSSSAPLTTPPPPPSDPRGRWNKENKRAYRTEKAIPSESGQAGARPATSHRAPAPSSPKREVFRRAGLTAGGMWPCHAISPHRDAEERTWQRPRILHRGHALLQPTSLEKAQTGSSLYAPDKVPSAYLLPAQHFPGTPHFPDVSSFVAVSWYQRQELLRRCVTPCSSFSLLVGPP